MLCARRNEELFQHLINVGELSKKIILETKIVRGIAESFSENFAELAYYSGVFHDVGKILYSYQKPLNKKCSEKDLSFPGHEVLSAFIASRVLNYLDFFNDLEKACVVKAILYHHQGLRELGTATSMLINRIKKSRKKEPLVYYSEALIFLKQLVKEIGISINVEEFLKRIEDSLISEDLILLLNKELSKHTKVLCGLSPSEAQKFISFRRIITGIVLVSDTYVASKTDKFSSTYAQDICLFVKYFE